MKLKTRQHAGINVLEIRIVLSDIDELSNCFGVCIKPGFLESLRSARFLVPPAEIIRNTINLFYI